MSIAKEYMKGLLNNSGFEYRDVIEGAVGADGSEIEQLLEIYPECSDGLIDILSIVNGTNPVNGEESVPVTLLGSDIDGMGYHLLSIEQIIDSSEENESLEEIYDIESIENGDVDIDPRIDVTVPIGGWLHFADCIENGETSKLYIDYTPSESGSSGQVIRCTFENSEYSVIADSFEEYLHIVMDDEYKFLS